MFSSFKSSFNICFNNIMIYKWINTFINNIANIIPSGYAKLNTLINTAKIPIRNPTIIFPLLVDDAVTGSVAIKTAQMRIHLILNEHVEVDS